MKKETLAIHSGYETDPTTNSVAVPIYQTVAYEFDDAQHGADQSGRSWQHLYSDHESN